MIKNSLYIICFAISTFLLPPNLAAQHRFILFHKIDSVLDITRENLSGNRVIRAFCKEDEEINISFEICEVIYDNQTRKETYKPIELTYLIPFLNSFEVE